MDSGWNPVSVSVSVPLLTVVVPPGPVVPVSMPVSSDVGGVVVGESVMLVGGGSVGLVLDSSVPPSADVDGALSDVPGADVVAMSPLASSPRSTEEQA
jgi:hypothetical protein